MSTYLSSFTEALREIVGEIGFNHVSIDTDTQDYPAVELVASVGITGGLSGFMMLQSDMTSARAFVDKMLTNMGVDAGDETGFGQFHKEAVGEIVNQVAGRSMMMLADQRIDCSITPPTIIAGSSIYTDIAACESSISHVLRGSFGKIVLFVGIKNVNLNRKQLT